MNDEQILEAKPRRWRWLLAVSVGTLVLVTAAAVAGGIPIPGTARYYPTGDLNALANKVTRQCSQFGSTAVRAEVNNLRRRVDVYNCVINMDLYAAGEREMFGSRASYGPEAIS